MKIEDAINKHSSEIRCLNRRYKILGEPSLETARIGYQKAGHHYIEKLLSIIGSESSSYGDEVGPPTWEQWQTQNPVQPKPTWQFLNFLDNLFPRINTAAETFNNVRNTAYKPDWYVVYDQNSKKINYTLLGAAAVLILLIILIFRK